MNFYGKAETIATNTIDAFKSGEVDAALASIFIAACGRHADSYSWMNQLIIALAGFADARGYKGWQSVGRQVRKGQRATLILAPCKRKVERGGEERFIVTGFRAMPVFGMKQTDIVDAEKWAAHNKGNESAQRFVDELPLRNVAASWGLTVSAYSGKGARAKGWYRHGQAIALGVENLATWTHELVHAADYRNGKLVERGQHLRSETVAELGGAIVLRCLGYEREADLGGAWEYIGAYARAAGIEPIKACMDVLKRTCEAVALILKTSDELALSSDTCETCGERQYICDALDHEAAAA